MLLEYTFTRGVNSIICKPIIRNSAHKLKGAAELVSLVEDTALLGNSHIVGLGYRRWSFGPTIRWKYPGRNLTLTKACPIRDHDGSLPLGLLQRMVYRDQLRSAGLDVGSLPIFCDFRAEKAPRIKINRRTCGRAHGTLRPVGQRCRGLGACIGVVKKANRSV